MSKNKDKLPGEHGRIAYSHGRKKNGMYFADFAPKGFSSLWAKSVVNTRHLIKEYAFAFKVTAVFALIAVLAVFIRLSQQASLADLLATVTTVTQDYNSLVSGDKFDSPERNDVSDNIITEGVTSPSGTPSSTSFSFDQTPNEGNATAPSDGGQGGSTNPGGGGGGTPEVTPTFAAAIGSFALNNPNGNLVCPGNITLQKRNCDKTYNFQSSVNTQNGPGVVSYGWQTSFSGGNSNGNYSAGPGSESNNLAKSITISCKDPGNYTMRFILTAPNSVQSTLITISHDCGLI